MQNDVSLDPTLLSHCIFILAGSVCSHRQVRERRQFGFVASRMKRSVHRLAVPVCQPFNLQEMSQQYSNQSKRTLKPLFAQREQLINSGSSKLRLGFIYYFSRETFVKKTYHKQSFKNSQRCKLQDRESWDGAKTDVISLLGT